MPVPAGSDVELVDNEAIVGELVDIAAFVTKSGSDERQSQGVGKLIATDRRIVWISSDAQSRLEVALPEITMHAISTDSDTFSSSYGSSCVFCLLDTPEPAEELYFVPASAAVAVASVYSLLCDAASRCITAEEDMEGDVMKSPWAHVDIDDSMITGDKRNRQFEDAE